MMNGNWYRNGGSHFWNFCNGFSIWHGMTVIGLILLVIALVYMLINKRNDKNNSLELLKIQFVNGKITEEEYLKRKNILER